MSRKLDGPKKAAPFGPVRKIQWLCGAAGRPDLSRAELAVLIVLADHINTETGKAWPAFSTIAAVSSVTVRTAKRAVRRLTDMELIQIAEHGGPGRSNRYRLNWGLFEQDGNGVMCDTTQDGMVTPVAAYGDTRGPNIVSPMSPYPINPSEQEAKDEIEGSQAKGVAAPLRSGACGLPPVKDGYVAFWDAWGRRVTVAETERLIASKVEDGAALADIIAGVVRFRKYCADTGKPPRIKPAAFVHGEKWRDDWQLYPAEPAKAKTCARKKPTKTKKATKARRVKNPWQDNPAHLDWYSEDRSETLRILKLHAHEFKTSFPQSDAEIDRFRELKKPWVLANPEPPCYKNTITGITWGKWLRDKLPEPDWSPDKQRSD